MVIKKFSLISGFTMFEGCHRNKPLTTITSKVHLHSDQRDWQWNQTEQDNETKEEWMWQHYWSYCEQYRLLWSRMLDYSNHLDSVPKQSTVRSHSFLSAPLKIHSTIMDRTKSTDTFFFSFFNNLVQLNVPHNTEEKICNYFNFH